MLLRSLFPQSPHFGLNQFYTLSNEIQTSADEVLTLSGQILINYLLIGRTLPVKAHKSAIFHLALLYLQAYLYRNKSHQCFCSFNEDLEIGNLSMAPPCPRVGY